MATLVRDISHTPCPSCQHGIGYVRGVRAESALKVLTYICETCQHRWQASQQWADVGGTGTPAPTRLRDDSRSH